MDEGALRSLMAYGGRYYNTQLQRFISKDPLPGKRRTRICGIESGPVEKIHFLNMLGGSLRTARALLETLRNAKPA
jgi:hypothetical protein